MSIKSPRHSLAPRLIQAVVPTTAEPDKTAPVVERARRINSRALLGGAASLVIDHEGVSYVLRATRLGKLILTK